MLNLILTRNTPFLVQTCILCTLATKNANFIFLKSTFSNSFTKKTVYFHLNLATVCSLRSIMVNGLTWLVCLGFIGGNITPVGQYLAVMSLFWLISKILRGEEWISEKIQCLVFVENVLVSNFHWTKFGELFCSNKRLDHSPYFDRNVYVYFICSYVTALVFRDILGSVGLVFYPKVL